MRMIGLLLCCAALIAAILFGGPLGLFFNGPSLVIVVVVGFGAVIFAHGMEGFSALLRATFLDVGDDLADVAGDAAHTAGKAFIGAGWIGTIIGWIQMLTQLDDPRVIGPALAVSFLTVFYGYFAAYLLWMPTERRMESRSLGG